MEFTGFYKQLPQISELIRLFERKDGEVFSVYEKDAFFVADEVYKTTTVLKTEQLTSCSLSKVQALHLVRDLLLVRGYSVEIWTCENRNWVISKRASPGNIKQLEDLLFSQSDLQISPFVMAVTLSKDLVGCCFTDASSSRLVSVSEFIDNDQFSNLESLLIQQNIKECLIPDENTFELGKIEKVVKRCGIVCTRVKKSLYQTKNIVQDLTRLLDGDVNVQGLPEFNLQAAMASTACIISYLDLLHDESNLGFYQLEQINLSSFMKLDSAAVLALNLNPGPKDGNKFMNLFGLLNRCKTAQGSRLLAQWIKQPLMNVEQIEKRQNVVQTFVDNFGLKQSIQENLKLFPDLHRMAKKFQRGKANLQDVVRVYQVIKSLPLLIELLDGYDGEYKDLIQEKFVSLLKEYNTDLTKLLELVEATIDMQALDNHEYLIKPDFDPSLQAKMNKAYDQLKPEARRVAGNLDVEFDKKLKFEFNPQFGHHLRLSRTDASKIRGNREYIELKTQKAGVLFTTATLRRLSTDYEDYGKEYQKLSKNIAKEILGITGTYFPVLELLNRSVAELDVYVSLCEAATSSSKPYVRPRVSDTGDFILKGSRHPCVEMQDDVSFIENDIELIDGQSMFHVITGPNMGGKSTFIRQIGVITLMAQIGSFVPCEEAQVRIVDAILARVGAGDSQLKGISTFMAEMLETAAILRNATAKSMIIIDELGRGTSTKDGFGLAWAIADFIAREIKCFTLFATHFHEITKLSEMVPIVKNYHVQAYLGQEGAKSFTLLYKVTPGACDQSFGIHVAELARFPDIVVQLAKRKASELEGFEKGEVKRWKSHDHLASGSQLLSNFLKEYATLQPPLAVGLEELKAKYDAEFQSNLFIQEAIHEF